MRKKTSAIAFSILLATFLIDSAQARQPIRMPIDEFTGKPADHHVVHEPGEVPLGKPPVKEWRPEFTRHRPQFPEGCSPSKWDPDNSVFWDLKRVNLVVRVIPNKYPEALKCHGQEEQCADNNGALLVHPEQRPEYIKALKDWNNTYRAPVRRENLIRVFSDVLKQKLMPHVVPGPDCKPLDPVVVDLTSNAAVEAIERDPATLTVSFELNIVDSTQPPIGVLTVVTYRPDRTYSSFWTKTQWYATAIPLDLPDDQIATRLNEFASHFPVNAPAVP